MNWKETHREREKMKLTFQIFTFTLSEERNGNFDIIFEG